MARRSRVRAAAWALAFAAVTTGVSACGEAGGAVTAGAADLAHVDLSCPVPAGPVVVAASARANSAAPEATSIVQSLLGRAIENQSYVGVVTTDGAPSLVDGGPVRITGANDVARKKSVQDWSTRLTSLLSGSEAQQPEADPLAALSLAARTARAQGETGTVALVDSGLQTAGALRFQRDGMLSASGKDITGQLRDRRLLPDLAGLTVVLSGLGDTAPPQQRLTEASRSRLVEQWQAIAEAAGAACVAVDEQPLTKAPPAGLPEVTSVDVPEPPVLDLSAGQPIALREDSVAFEDNSPRLRDPHAAERVLRDLADQIDRTGVSVKLVGTTATAGTEAGRLSLSSQRAKAVRDLLVSLGVPASRITTRGAGTDYPAHVDDIDADGNLIPSAAARNRAVFVEVER